MDACPYGYYAIAQRYPVVPLSISLGGSPLPPRALPRGFAAQGALRLGRARGLTAPQAVIQDPRAVPLRSTTPALRKKALHPGRQSEKDRPEMAERQSLTDPVHEKGPGRTVWLDPERI